MVKQFDKSPNADTLLAFAKQQTDRDQPVKWRATRTERKTRAPERPLRSFGGIPFWLQELLHWETHYWHVGRGHRCLKREGEPRNTRIAWCSRTGAPGAASCKATFGVRLGASSLARGSPAVEHARPRARSGAAGSPFTAPPSAVNPSLRPGTSPPFLLGWASRDTASVPLPTHSRPVAALRNALVPA